MKYSTSQLWRLEALVPTMQGDQRMQGQTHLSFSWQYDCQTANTTLLAQAQQHPAVATGMYP